MARGAADRGTDAPTGRAGDRIAAVRTVGDMQARYRSARRGPARCGRGDRKDPGADDATMATVAIAKRTAVLQARTIVDLALELADGRSSVRSPLERAHRDVRGGPFHPLTPEATLDLPGSMRLEEVRTS
ncbi:acyl-CoA/acyl-ACP dehydrogenase [Nakamurella leprariae]|uniref:Acyl-CoA/acyl-ACP dehydrogenase n=1 Tax=Nakamurella leprariae TaxID=2803911 RepID=A0A938Y9R0_9ACTN|nr:acyl-CoA/acyl-ACP dehydrogenase [Nakamurella leprariae]